MTEPVGYLIAETSPTDRARIVADWDGELEVSNNGDQCRYGKCECPRCRCGAALDSPACEDYHRRRPYSKRGAK